MSPDNLKRRLSTIHSDDPTSIRDEFLAVLEEAIPAGLAVFFKCVEDSDGNYHLTSPVHRGSNDFLRSKVDEKLRGPAPSAPWLPSEVDPEIIDNFVRVRSFYRERRLLTYEMQTEVTRPLGISDHLRTVLYDGPRFLGWMGLARVGGDEFQPKEEKLAASAIQQFKAGICAAEALEAQNLDDELFAIVTPGGEVEHATDTFARWYDDSNRRDYLRRRTRDVDAGVERDAIEIYDGAEIRLVRLDGPTGVRYLVTIDRPELLRLNPLAWLTQRQREIAEYAAAGATNREIANTLDLSRHTVKTHLKNAYTRLGIASRTELANIFQADS